MRIAILAGGKAIEYGVGVGREGFTLTRQRKASRKTEWPELPATQGWNVRFERSPIPEHMPSGPDSRMDSAQDLPERQEAAGRQQFSRLSERLGLQRETAPRAIMSMSVEAKFLRRDIGGQIAALRKAFMHLAADVG